MTLLLGKVSGVLIPRKIFGTAPDTSQPPTYLQKRPFDEGKRDFWKVVAGKYQPTPNPIKTSRGIS